MNVEHISIQIERIAAMDERLYNAPCGYICITQEGIIMEANQTFLDRMGYTASDLLDKPIETIMSTVNKLTFHEEFYPAIRSHGQVNELFLCLQDDQGRGIPYLMNAKRVERNGTAVIDCILMQTGKRIDYEEELQSANKKIEAAYIEKDQALVKLREIYAEIEQKQAELIEMNAILVELSVTDKLTGLKNRRFFQDKLEEQIERYNRLQEPFSLLIVDIDHFKEVNDTFGHQVGDEVLAKLASVLQAHSRREDIVARFGGEEFVVIAPNTDGIAAMALAESLRYIVSQSIWTIGALSISVGVAAFTPEDDADSVLRHADQALYQSKRSGRNRVTYYSPFLG